MGTPPSPPPQDFQTAFVDAQNLFCGDDIFSIKNQFMLIKKRDITYRCYKKAISLILEQNHSMEMEHTLFDLLDETYFESFLLSIRRIIDNDTTRPEKRVYSLRRLLAEIREIPELNRRNYVYRDPGANTNCKELERLTFFRNLNFDRVSNRRPEDRSLSDTISSELLDEIDQKIKAIDNRVKTIVNKLIAHAAAPANRHTLEDDLSSFDEPTVNEIFEDLIAIIQRFEVILDRGLPDGLPPIRSDEFKNWNQPLLRENDSHAEQALRDLWRERNKDYRKHAEWKRNTLKTGSVFDG
jgi:hypothetical protein